MPFVFSNAKAPRLIAAIVLGAAMATSSPAFAAPTDDAIALQRFEEGRVAYEAGKLGEALAAFRASIELKPSPNSRLYIGRCLRGLGKTASAFTTLRLAAREAQDRLVASGEKRYAATRDAANLEAAELEPKVPYATIAVPSDVPKDYKVTLDGDEIPRSVWGTALPLDPGDHVVATSGHRVAPFEEKFSLKDGDKRRVDAKATRLPTATLALSFATRPVGLEVQIDGAAIDPEEAKGPRELDPGEHTIDATAPGCKPWRVERALADRDAVTVDVKLVPLPATVVRAEESSGPPRWIFFVVSAASVVALGTGAYLAVSASSTASDEKAKDPLVRDPALQDRVRSESTTANVLFIAGATLAVGAGVLFFTTKWNDERKIGAGAWTTVGGGVLGVRGEL